MTLLDCGLPKKKLKCHSQTALELLTGSSMKDTGKRKDCAHMGAGLESSVLMNSMCQGFMSLSKSRMRRFYVVFCGRDLFE